MCMLVNFSEALFPRQRRTFLLTFILIGVISVLELVTVIVDGTPVRLRPVNIMEPAGWIDGTLKPEELSEPDTEPPAGG